MTNAAKRATAKDYFFFFALFFVILFALMAAERCAPGVSCQRTRRRSSRIASAKSWT
jgi:hypothetical protein